MKTAFTVSLLAAALSVGMAVAAPASDAQGRNRHTTVTNSRGKTATADHAVSRNGSTVQRSTQVQTGEGRGFTRNSEAGYDAEAGERYRSSSLETNSGKTASHDMTASCNEGACNRNATFTGPEGQTATRDVNRDGEGAKTTTVTGPDGETRSRTRWVTVEPAN